MKKFGIKTLVWLNLVTAFGLLLSITGPLVNPVSFWPAALVGFAFPYFLFINIVFVFVWAFLFWRYMFVSLICIIASYQSFTTYFQFTARSTSSPKALKILSYNVHTFNSFLYSKKNNDAILNFIAAQRADIICIQEAKIQNTGPLNPTTLINRFPGIKHCHFAHSSTWNGNVTFSKYPIVKMGEIRFEETANMIIFTDIRIKLDTIRVYNCHLESYKFDTNEYTLLDSIAIDPIRIKEAKSLRYKFKDAYQKRSVQVDKLMLHAKKSKLPIVICGDFNDTPFSYVYRQTTKKFFDTFIESGKGFERTYQGRLPSYRIDYIFHSNDFNGYDFKSYKVNYSDHYPISSKLILK